MGRPPIGKVAMTGAERTRLYRLKHGTDKPRGDLAMKELDRLMKNRGPGSTKNWPAAEVRELQKWLAKLRYAAMRVQKIKNRNP
jgi:hypothetical protein